MAVTFTQDDLDTLKDALVTGLTELTVQGRQMKFRTKDELVSLINMIENQLNASTTDPETDFVVGGFDKRNTDEQ